MQNELPADYEIGFDYRVYTDDQGRTILEYCSDRFMVWTSYHIADSCDRIGARGFILNESMGEDRVRRILAEEGFIDEAEYVRAMHELEIQFAMQHDADMEVL